MTHPLLIDPYHFISLTDPYLIPSQLLIMSPYNSF
jgi:hypothetical protein